MLEILEIVIGVLLGLIAAIIILIVSYDPQHEPWDGSSRR
jgi:hypothetical protein